MTIMFESVPFKSLNDLMLHYCLDTDTLVTSESSFVKVPKIHHSLVLFSEHDESETFSIEFAKEIYGDLTAYIQVIDKLNLIKAKFTSFREQAAAVEAYDTCNLFFNVIGEDQYRVTVMATKLVDLGEKEIEVSLQSNPNTPNPIESLLEQLDIGNFIQSFD